MSEKNHNSTSDRILREIGIRGRKRDPEIMSRLTSAIIHPAELSESVHLCDDDPLKIAGRFVLEDFESVTNGMSRPGPRGAYGISEPESPLYPWYLLTEAVAAFYRGDIETMKKTVRMIPEDTAVASLKNIFENLSGKPSSPGRRDSFPEKIRGKNSFLMEGLEVLDEAAFYPEMLRKEIGRYVKEMAGENTEAAERLYYWAMEILSEEAPLSGSDELDAVVPGTGEASRICALASIPYDPDRAIMAWLRSLDAVLEEGSLSPQELTVRLKIAGEIMQLIREEELLTEELISGISSRLEFSFPKIRKLLPDISAPPSEPEELLNWFFPTDNRSPSIRSGRTKKKRSRGSTDLLLFEEVL
jgi:hypothetical protein